MNVNIFIGLVNNAALLLSLGLIYDIFYHWKRATFAAMNRIVSGLIIAVMAIVLMATPVKWEAGIIFDTRTILLGLTGLFFGTLPTLLAMAIAGAYRLHLGGGGALMGVATIISSGVIGLAWRHYRFRSSKEVLLLELYVFGVVVHAAMILCMFLLPQEAIHRTISTLSLPVIIIYPACTALLGNLLTSRRKRHRVEEELQESEGRYRRIVETSLEGIWTTNKEHRTTFVNKHMADMLGYTPEEIQGRKVDYFMFEEDVEDYRSRVSAREQGVGQVFERRFRRKDGATIWNIVSASPLFDGQSRLTGSFAMFTDITDRKRVEEELRVNEQAAKRLAKESELIAEIGRIISSTLDIEQVYERFADKVKELIPFDRIAINTFNRNDYTRTVRYAQGDMFPGNRIGEVVPLAGTGLEQLIRTKSSLLITSKSTEDLRRRLFSAFQYGTQSTMMIPLILKDEVIGALAIHSTKIDAYSENDLRLAERMASQIAGTIANAELFRERTQAEEERKVLTERLQRSEKMEAMGTLAGGVAHDLNNVLGVLSGYSELLVERLPAGSPLREYAANILKSSEKGAAIIQDLLTLARRGVVVAEVVDFNRVVANLLATPEFGKLMTYHPRVTVKTDLEENLLNIKGSPVHLEKTVLNLVSNAMEAISGSGEVNIRTENRYLDKAVQGYDRVQEGEYVVLTVSDTGTGISSEDMRKMFEPFYTKKKMGRSGTGLGLAIVWGTVKDHQGYIDAQSIEAQGTTFTLYFPATREKISVEAKQISIESYLGHGESVLVVDDVPEQRQVATTLLEHLGYQVNSVSSGEEAVEYLKTYPADILVLDMIMEPGIDGLETYQRILGINPQQKAIIVSGFSETDRAKEAQRIGAGAYVRKPYLKEKIGVAIRKELENRG